jgi:hypothetical protein
MIFTGWSMLKHLNQTSQDGKACKCLQNDLLPFSALNSRTKSKEDVIKIPHNNKGTSNFKVSSMRVMTSEPVHRKHAKLTRKGKQIARFSDRKVILDL